MCLSPVHALILHSAEACIPLSLDRTAYCIPRMSFSFGREVTGHRLCECLGTLRSRLRRGALTASAKPEDAPVKLLDFPRHTLGANRQPGPFKHAARGLASKTGECSTTIPHTKKVKRGSSRLEGCSRSTLSALCSSTPLCLSSFFLSVHLTFF